MGAPAEVKKVQEIETVGLYDKDQWGRIGAPEFSELRRDLHLMAGFTEE